MPDEVLEELDLQNKEPDSNSCFIESLTELAWLDPFPKDDVDVDRSKYTKSVVDYMFRIQERKMEVKTIVSFALPSKAVMIKIMRASIGVENACDLWINIAE